MPRRFTKPTRKVVEAFLADPTAERYGLELMRFTSLTSGSLYPLLHRLEGDGWVTSRMEEIDPAKEGRPPRRLYRITGEGERAARRLVTERGPLLGALQPGMVQP